MFPFPKRFQDPTSGFHRLSSMHAKKYLNKIGLEREDYNFWKQAGKALLCTYAIIGAVWLYHKASQQPKFRYPGDEEAMKEFIAKRGMIGTTNGPKGVVESDEDASNNQKELQSNKFDQEAQKLWLKMRNEVIAELQEKGFDVE
ncbi:uncharacterized protein LOC133316297 [Gastrolobium bilobum]|uniref:uncharacterized protein LOC133316297 n=1 Tax=Gastrolobium bilobum TaxID=150636 RepID=UPI002AB1ABAC|nr:uncharacterized protein LOC133316297 [Gastrolobium bilobum]